MRNLGSVVTIVALVLGACGPAPSPSTAPPSQTASVPSTPTAQLSAPPAASPTSVDGLPSPVAAWPLQGDGAASIGGIDLQFEGGYTMTASGVAFDGVTGRAVTISSVELDTAKSLSVSAWVTYSHPLDDLTYVVSLTDGGELRMVLGTAGTPWYYGTTDADLFAGHSVRSDEWVYLTAVSDRDAHVIRLYVNGEQAGEQSDDAPAPAGGPLYIGGSPEGNGWGGAVTDVAVYQAALTADQVAEIFRTTRPAATSPQWTPDPSTYAEGILDGTWDYRLRKGPDSRLIDQLRSDFGQAFEEAVVRMGFDGPRWWQGVLLDGQLQLEEGVPAGDGGIIQIDGHRLITRAGHGVTTFDWALDGEKLVFSVVSDCTPDGECLTRDELADQNPLVLLFNDHTFTKSGEDASY